jgi:formylglycine-generating enzyme required for sulfatase activity
MLNVWSPLAPSILWQLRQEDEQSEAWVPVLIRELQDELAIAQGMQHQLAAQAITVLECDEPPPVVKASVAKLTAGSLATEKAPTVQSYWSPGRILIYILLMFSLVTGLLFYRSRNPQQQMVTIPADDYTLGEPTAERTLVLAAFAIDATEVNNAAYRQCLAVGQCPVPGVQASSTRPDYFVDAAFAAYPVVNVDWDAAQAYCAWRGNRLPTAEEWEVAAAIAPATQRHFRFPWGNRFDSRLANSAAAKVGDTTLPGAYHPAGDSPFGLADMAGNVAEWTATRASDNSNAYLVKGGSFRDEPAGIQTSAQQVVERQTFANWLGFRCAVTLAP